MLRDLGHPRTMNVNKPRKSLPGEGRGGKEPYGVPGVSDREARAAVAGLLSEVGPEPIAELMRTARVRTVRS